MLRTSQRGFSVIEVLLSFTILTVAVLGMLGLMPVASRQQSSSDAQNTALYLCQQQMDQLMTSPGSFPTPAANVTVGQQAYTVTNTIAVDATKNNCFVCTVDVSWREQQASKTSPLIRHVTLQTLVKP